MPALYTLFLLLYRTAISVIALWNSKAKAWRDGRQDQWTRLKQHFPNPGTDPVVWMHCASLGEFEQGRPLLEKFKIQNSKVKIILTFFSPSGYEVRKDYAGADVVCYLPMDGPRAAKRFLDIVQPSLALFVKYEFWHYYLNGLSDRKVPTVLVSGAFRDSQPFFKWWGGFFRDMLQRFSVLTVQDGESLRLLGSIGLGDKTHLTGDTRYDRVVQIAGEARALSQIELFKGTDKLIIAGSTWPEDEEVLHASMPALPDGWKLVIAPHEVHTRSLSGIQSLFGDDCIFYSHEVEHPWKAKVLVIDNIGMLSSLYRYGEIAFIGGGFNRSGIHNVLEPAVFGLPVVMGPEYQKFREAADMVKAGFAFPVTNAEACESAIRNLTQDKGDLVHMQHQIRAFIRERTGATAKILALLPHVL